jgi:hypothetical protein
MLKDDHIRGLIFTRYRRSEPRPALASRYQHGKHVATAVPAVFGLIEDADKLLETVMTCAEST